MTFVYDPATSPSEYAPGDSLASRAKLVDSFNNRVRLLSAPLSYAVEVEVLKPCTGICNTNFTSLFSKRFNFEQSGWLVLANSPTQLPWPPTVAGNLPTTVREFEPLLWLSHTLASDVQGVTMPTVVYSVSRKSCRDGTGYDETNQVCQACLTTQYVINPDQHPCRACPPGAECDGTKNLKGNPTGSVWTIVEDLTDEKTGIFRLDSCPTGHRVVQTDGGVFSAAVQECAQCDAGTHCTTATCITCSDCPAGTYKDQTGVFACRECPVNTYRPGTKGILESDCTPCEASTTDGTGKTSIQDCACQPRTYRQTTGTTFACRECPDAAICSDDDICLIEKLKEGIMNCTGVIGKWSTDVANAAQLDYCPTGYFRDASDVNNLQCVPCPAGSECTTEQCTTCSLCNPGWYKPNAGTGACEPCPINTYRIEPGASQLANCKACWLESTTNETTGATGPQFCLCKPAFWFKPDIDYAASGLGSCVACQQKAICPGTGVCMFQSWNYSSSSNVNCGGVVGTWQVASTREYALVSCPGGYAPGVAGCTACTTCANDENGDAVEWCRLAQYILSGVMGESQGCMTCPLGAECNGQALRAKDGLDAFGAVWVKDFGAGLMYLRGCPVGYQLRNATVEDQECAECESDEYIYNSNDPSFSCHLCPASATCPYGGPPNFGQVLTTTISIAGLDLKSRTDVAALAQAIADLTGLDPSAVVIEQSCDATAGNSGVCDNTARRHKVVHASLLRAVDKNRPSPSLVRAVGTNRTHYEVNLSPEQSPHVHHSRRLLQSSSSVAVKMVTSEGASKMSSIKDTINAIQSDSSSLVSAVSLYSNKTVAVSILEAVQEFVSANFGWIYEIDSTGVSVLVGCPSGTLLINISVALQECFVCEPNTYSLDPTDACALPNAAATQSVCGPRECNRCPAGASCSGRDAFTPLTDNSCWKREKVAVGTLGSHVVYNRIVSCPPGYVLVRNQDDPTLDQCAQCPLDFYGLERSVYQGVDGEGVMVSSSVTGHDVAQNGSYDGSNLCIPCAFGASCSGFQINILTDYWRGPDMHCPDDACTGFRGCDPRMCYRQASTTITREDDAICPILTGMSDAQRRGLMAMPYGEQRRFLAREHRRLAGGRRAEEERMELGDPGIIGVCPEGVHCRLKTTVHICPLDACPGQKYEEYYQSLLDGTSHNAQCFNGRQGPVCALCRPGWALSSGVCTGCEGTSNAARIVVFTIAGIAALIVWYMASWTVFLAPAPGDIVIDKESLMDKAIVEFGLKARVDKFKFQLEMVKAKVQPLMVWAKEIGITECVKITMSFYQIVASFPVMYSIPWPTMISDMFSDSSSFAYLDVMGSLGISCMSSAMQYLGVQVVYTVFPLVVIMMLFAPSGVLMALGRMSEKGDSKSHRKYPQVISNFFQMLMLWLFIIYPTVSVTVLKTFNCDSPLELLRVDYRVACPWMALDPLFFYASVFVLIYPIGIPAISYVILWAHGIPRIAKSKMYTAAVESLITQFRKCTTSQEGAIIGRLVGNPGDPGFKEKVEELFAQIDSDGGGSLDAEELVEHFKAYGMPKMSVERLKPIMKQINLTVDDEITPAAFEVLVTKLAGSSLAFTGHEQVEELSHEQLRLLYVFPWIRYEKMKAKWQENAALEAIEKNKKLQAANLARLQSGGEDGEGRKGSSGDSPSTSEGSSGNDNGGIPDVKKPAPVGEAGDQAEEEEEGAGQVKDEMFETFQDPIKVIRADNKTEDQLREKIMEKAQRLAQEKIITIRALKWDGSTEEECVALERIGSIFAPYKVEFWYFEMIEMGRKLILTSIMAFFFTGSTSQIAGGLIILFFSTLFFLALMPYRKSTLNGMQVYALVAQVGTLFYGLMVRAEKAAGGAADQSFVPYIIFLMDILVVLYPIFDLVRKSKQYANVMRKIITCAYLRPKKEQDVRIPVRPAVLDHDQGSAPVHPILQPVSLRSGQLAPMAEGGPNEEDSRVFIRNYITDTNREFKSKYKGRRLSEGNFDASQFAQCAAPAVFVRPDGDDSDDEQQERRLEQLTRGMLAGGVVPGGAQGMPSLLRGSKPMLDEPDSGPIAMQAVMAERRASHDGVRRKSSLAGSLASASGEVQEDPVAAARRPTRAGKAPVQIKPARSISSLRFFELKPEEEDPVQSSSTSSGNGDQGHNGAAGSGKRSTLPQTKKRPTAPRKRHAPTAVYGKNFFQVEKGPHDGGGRVDTGDVEAGLVHADGVVPPVYDFQSAIQSSTNQQNDVHGLSQIGSWAMGVIDRAGIGASGPATPKATKGGAPDLDEMAT